MGTIEREIRIPAQKRSKAKKNAIISAAKELFIENGYVAVNTNEIAKEARVSVGTLYAYFKDKREIFLHIMEDCNSEFRKVCERNRTSFVGDDDPRIVIERFFDTMMSALSVYGNLFNEYHTHVADSVEEKRAFFAAQNQIMFEIFISLLDTWHDKLRVTNTQVATLMILEWGFTVVDLIAAKRHPVPPEVLKQELLDIVCRYLFN